MEIPEFRIEEFIIDEDFEKEGGQASVIKGLHSTHGEVAIKRWFSASDDMKKEVELLKINIIQFLGILINKKSKCIGYVMPYMAMGSLHDIIHDKSQEYDQKQIKSWTTQICYGLSYLHGKQIIHRDIKPHNVLLGKSRDDVKLSDFGMAKSLEIISYALTKLGTPLYVAPEVLRRQKYDKSADIYSLSITIWEILCRRVPYDHIMYEVDFLSKVANGERPQLNNNFSAEVSDLLTKCWHDDASKRSTIHDVLDFFSNTGFVYTSVQHVVNEYETVYEKLNVHSNDYESLTQILSKTSIQKSPEKQTILLLDVSKEGSLMMLENNEQSWKELNIKLPYPTFAGGAQFVNNSLYIFGGIIEKKGSNCTHKLSTSLKWEKMADMNQKRSEISNSNVILNNQIWICGGQDENGKELKSVEMYDPLANEWKYMEQLNQYRSQAAAAVANGKIFCSGGKNRRKQLNSVECYDPSSDIWTLICDMPQSMWGHGAAEMNGNFIVMGGFSDDYQSSKKVWTLDTTDENTKWIKEPPMSILRIGCSVAKIDGKVFVCGGDDNVEIFDGKVWRNGPKIQTRRMYAPAVVIPMEFARYLEQFIPNSSRCPVQ